MVNAPHFQDLILSKRQINQVIMLTELEKPHLCFHEICSDFLWVFLKLE